MGDGWRLAQGTLTALPSRPPLRVDPQVASRAVLLAPAAVLPAAALVVGVLLLGRGLGLTPVAVAFAALAGLALATRAFHLDGLADTADSLTCSYDRERSLAVMRTGDTGPAGAAALVLVLGVQAGALAGLLALPRGPLLAGVAVCLSRLAHSLACRRGVPAARPDGLGAVYAGCLPTPRLVLAWALAGVVAAGTWWWAGLAWWHGLVGVAVAVTLVLALLRRAVRRLGGVNGDVFGASIEVALACLLVSAV